MAFYLSLDAGGSKCAAMLFDEKLNLLGSGLTGGVNTTQTTPEEARMNVSQCLDQVFCDVNVDRIDCLYYSFVGHRDMLHDEGILALSGTGSDVFWVTNEAVSQNLYDRYPKITVQKPCFEHLMAGPVRFLMDQGMQAASIEGILEARFPKYVIRW